VQSANPSAVTFDWNLDTIITAYDRQVLMPHTLLKSEDHGGPPLSAANDDLDSPVNIDMSHYQHVYHQHGGASIQSPQPSPSIPLGSVPLHSSSIVSSKFSGLASEGFTSRFRWRPASTADFGLVKCKVSNEIGSNECSYEIKLGGVPNPPTDCMHTLKNTSAIISCQVGFHQGDPDIYCYLLRKSENGVYKEHTRNRESCSFIVNEVSVNKFNEFWVYSSNRHGHNKDTGVYLTIGEAPKCKLF
jgi:hypothetical protein